MSYKSSRIQARTVRSISLSPEESEAVDFLMKSGGYSNFSQFTKSKIFGVASETEKRLHDLEIAIDNLRQGYNRHHNLWVDTVKKVSGSDGESLVAATYMLLHMMAAPQDRAVMKKFVDLHLVEKMVDDDNLNNYRPIKTPYRP